MLEHPRADLAMGMHDRLGAWRIASRIRRARIDIHYSADGASADGRGLAALKISGSYRMYQVELLTGKARLGRGLAGQIE